MVDVTDAPVPTGASEFNVPGDMKDLADHFGAQEMFAVANAAALPVSDNWNGRLLTTLDNGAIYQWLGSEWRQVAYDSGFTSVSTFSTGVTAVAGQPPRVRQVSGQVHLYGAINIGGAWAPHPLLLVPPGFRITSSAGNIHVGSVNTSTGKSVSLWYDTGTNYIRTGAGYYTALPASGDVLPLRASWFVDNPT